MQAPGSHFLLDCLSIILIDLLLAGDNALVIALVVRALPKRQRFMAIGAGAGIAVVLRVALTFVAAQLLQVEFLQLAGGAFVLWIAVKVLVDAGSGKADARQPARLSQAICWIVLADITMSTDNILAVAGASHGSLELIWFGLCVSIPFVIFSSSLLSRLMDRYPVVVYLGAAILGKVGGDMMLTDAFVVRHIHPSDAVRYGVDAALAIAVVVAGRIVNQLSARTESMAESGAD
ncbi:MAG: TerC family protein [Acidobacteria bacterium]|nr:TerC family protein [Acidobacteriota bacterium]